MRKKDTIKTLDEFRHQTAHLIGEVNFMRRENDLIKVSASVLQSAKVLMQTMALARKNHAEKHLQLVDSYMSKIEEALDKIVKHVTTVFRALGAAPEEEGKIPDERPGAKNSFCVPAVCICYECIARILMALVATVYTFANEKFSEENLVLIISQVGFFSAKTKSE